MPLLLLKRLMGALGFAVAGEEEKGVVGARCGWEMWMRLAPAARVAKKGRFHWLTSGPGVGGRHKLDGRR